MSGIVALSLLFAVVTSITAGPFVSGMRRISHGQHIRDYGPQLHVNKTGTATMGGALILLLWGGAAAILHTDIPQEGLFVLLNALLFGGIGLLDDLLSQVHSRSLGLLPRQKIALSSLAVVVLFFAFPSLQHTAILVPFSRVTFLLPRPLFFLLMCGVLISTTNSMNLTDGLDGLAAGTSIIVLSAYLVLFHDRAMTATILPLIGILIGFLWVNSYPARLFLGDVGSFALGGAIGGLAITTGTELSLPLIAGLLVAESASVIVQLTYFRFTRRRIFKISPLHHHFEAAEGIDYDYLLPDAEWPEPKIVVRLWIVQTVLAVTGILSLYR